MSSHNKELKIMEMIIRTLFMEETKHIAAIDSNGYTLLIKASRGALGKHQEAAQEIVNTYGWEAELVCDLIYKDEMVKWIVIK